jgi:ABC-2 type transport system permease protein
VRNLRLLVVGGYLSYRALFGWLNPYLYVATILLPSITQLAFFVYLGRAARVESDAYYVAGNALLAAAVPSLFGMAQAIAGERYANTLPLLVASPASRVAVFLGRALPATVNGVVVSIWTLAVAAVLFGVAVPGSALAPLGLTIAVSAFSCVGIGLFNAALGLRWRESGVLGNLLLYVLLLFAGVNIPLDRLPGWLSTLAQGLPITHGAEAARALLAGRPLGHELATIAAEAAVGSCYAVVGLIAIRAFERAARRGATLELA